LNHVIFFGNSASNGGAIHNYGVYGNSSPSLSNVVFYSNTGSYGGAIYNYGIDYFNNPKLNNATFFGNSAERGGAIFNNNYNSAGSLDLSNVILWGNTAVISGSQLYNSGVTTVITTSLVQGGITGTGVVNTNDSSVTDGGGNIDSNPLFIDPTIGNLRLQTDSPAIETGTNINESMPTDLDGNPRIVDGNLDGTAIIDMGAYEYPIYDVYLPAALKP
jgi:predicted outer membrane repeat protein